MTAVVVGGEAVDLLAMHMVLSWSWAEAVVWSRAKDTLSWLACHTACLARLGGVTATLRMDNERTTVSRGAGAWGTVNPVYRRYGMTLHAQSGRAARFAGSHGDGQVVEYLAPAPSNPGREAWLLGGGDNAEVVYDRPR